MGPEWSTQVIKDEVDKHTADTKEKFKQMDEEINKVKSDNIELKLENSNLEKEIDETRQRGLKGNLLISAPPKNGQPHPRAKPEPIGGNGRLETVTEMCLRMIKEKSGVQINKSEITACHLMPGSPHTWILRVADRSPGSGWETLCAGMYTGKKAGSDNYFENDGVFINFHLTKIRSKLLNEVRAIRRGHREHLHKFSVNQNGKIHILRKKVPFTPRGQHRDKEVWEVVNDQKHLARMFPSLQFPLTAPPRVRETN